MSLPKANQKRVATNRLTRYGSPMLALNREQITAAFDEGEVLHVPDLENVQWPSLDYFGWVHPSGHVGFVVLQSPNDGRSRGIRMSRAKRSAKKNRGWRCVPGAIMFTKQMGPRCLRCR